MEDDFEIFFWKRHREKERVTVLESKYTNTFRKEFVLEIPVLLQIFIRNSGFSLGPLFVVRVSVVKFTAPFSSPSPVSYTERARKLERDSSNFPKLYDFFHDNLTESRNTVISFTRGRSNEKKNGINNIDPRSLS